MKIFALYIKIKLTKKPEWFDGFLNKYFEPVDLHVTLIQPRYVDEKQIYDLESRITETIKNISISEIDKKLLFDKLVIEKESDGKYVFMLNARENNFLTNFQKELILALRDHDLYVDDANKEDAEKYFTLDYELEGLMGELVLPIVKDTSIEERTDINNLRVFKL